MSFKPRMLNPSRTGPGAEALEQNLRQMIVGQDEAIRQIVDIYQRYITGMSAPQRPIGNFLFLGPTGTGKTRIVEATADALVGNPGAVIKIDCAEFQYGHEIAKLIGSPPGYLGHRETHAALSQEAINQRQTDKVQISFLLFDEIEKSSDALWNLLLGILDKATLTLGDNRKVDFSRVMIFMTSNLGSAEMNALLAPRIGFGAINANTRRAARHLDKNLNGKIRKTGIEAAKRKFRPEFINRLDKIAVFLPLGEAELQSILEIELRTVQQRISNALAEGPFVFQITKKGKDRILSEGIRPEYGARHLKRTIERLLVQPLSNLIATDQVKMGDLILVDFDSSSETFTFLKKSQNLSLYDMSRLAHDPAKSSLYAVANGTTAETKRTQAAPEGSFS